MEDHENVDPPSADPDLSRELSVLKAERANLITQLDYEQDPDVRAEIDVHLMQNRMNIERIVGDFTGEIPTIRPTERSYVVATGEHPTSRAQYEASGVVGSPGVRQPAPMAHDNGRRPIRWRWVATGALVTLCVVGLAALALKLSDDEQAGTVVSDTTAVPAGVVDEIAGVLAAMGLGDVEVAMEGDAILLSGTVASEEIRASAIGAAEALAAPKPVDATQLTVQDAAPAEGAAAEPTPRADALQQDLNRTLASTPLIFDTSATELTELHVRILNDVAASLLAYPDLAVRVVGYSDAVGDPETNRRVSLARAEGVKGYLVQQGVSEGSLTTDARGEEGASGADVLGGLERRVELEVVGTTGAAGPSGDGLRVAIVAPSAKNDLAFTQSMVDAVNVVAGERGDVDVAVTDSTFVPDEAAAAIRGYADQGYDLVIAHGSQFGGAVLEIAPEYPEVAFAWGTASDTFGLPNVYAYDAASNEGGYVLGSMAAQLSGSGIVGVVGPIEVGDAERYVNGFQAGARAEAAGLDVRVTYTDSFSDLALASEAAQAHLDAGADVMTGSAQMVVGAVNVASANNVPWFGTQANQTSLAPNLVVASQVYHWEVILRTIIADIETGNPTGASYSATLANGGLVIEFNADFPLPAEIRQRGDQVIADVSSGAVTTG
jgi:basic membrane protein A